MSKLLLSEIFVRSPFSQLSWWWVNRYFISIKLFNLSTEPCKWYFLEAFPRWRHCSTYFIFKYIKYHLPWRLHFLLMPIHRKLLLEGSIVTFYDVSFLHCQPFSTTKQSVPFIGWPTDAYAYLSIEIDRLIIYLHKHYTLMER